MPVCMADDRTSGIVRVGTGFGLYPLWQHRIFGFVGIANWMPVLRFRIKYNK